MCSDCNCQKQFLSSLYHTWKQLTAIWFRPHIALKIDEACIVLAVTMAEAVPTKLLYMKQVVRLSATQRSLELRIIFREGVVEVTARHTYRQEPIFCRSAASFQIAWVLTVCWCRLLAALHWNQLMRRTLETKPTMSTFAWNFTHVRLSNVINDTDSIWCETSGFGTCKSKAMVVWNHVQCLYTYWRIILSDLEDQSSIRTVIFTCSLK